MFHVKHFGTVSVIATGTDTVVATVPPGITPMSRVWPPTKSFSSKPFPQPTPVPETPLNSLKYLIH